MAPVQTMGGSTRSVRFLPVSRLPKTCCTTLTLLLAALSCFGTGNAFDSTRCMACSAVTSELKDRLQKEKPRNHLDMRHRLDSEGKRYGKTIDYRFSELRVVELLDGVCDSMKDYELKSIATDLTDQAEAWQWIHPKHTQHRPLQDNTTDKAQLKQQQRRLQNYCAQLLDKYEEQMSAALQQGSSAEDLDHLLCTKLSADCEKTNTQKTRHTEL